MPVINHLADCPTATDPAKACNCFRRRWTNEAAEARQKQVDLYNGVAQHLPGWRVETTETEVGFNCELLDDKDHGIELKPLSGANRGKVHVFGSWPLRGPHGPYATPSTVSEVSPSINCSLARGYESIARDIERRFIPNYLRIFDLITTKLAEETAYADRKAANWRHLVDAGLVRPRQQRSADADQIGDPAVSPDVAYGDIRMTTETTLDIHLRSVPVAVAMRVLAALKGGAA